MIPHLCSSRACWNGSVESLAIGYGTPVSISTVDRKRHVFAQPYSGGNPELTASWKQDEPHEVERSSGVYITLILLRLEKSSILLWVCTPTELLFIHIVLIQTCRCDPTRPIIMEAPAASISLRELSKTSVPKQQAGCWAVTTRVERDV